MGPHAYRRNFLAVWPSLFVVSVGLMAFLPTLPFYLEERFGLRDKATIRLWSGAIFGIAPFAAALCGPVWGALADRYGRKPMALRALGGICLVTGVMPLADTPLALLWLRALQGVLAGYIAPALALVSVDVPGARQGLVIGRLQVAMALGLLAGPVLGAEIAAAAGREAVFFVTSGLALAAFATVLSFAREDRTRLRPPAHLSARVLWAEMREVLGGRLLPALLCAIFLMRFGQSMVEAFIALWVAELGPLPWIAEGSITLQHAEDRTTALAFSILAVGQILVVSLWGRLADRFGPLACLAALALCLSVVLAATGLARSIEGFLVLRCVAALFMAGSMTLAYAAVAKRVASEHKSFAFACTQSSVQFGLCFGPLSGGVLSGATGIGGLFFVAAGCLLAAGLAMLRLRRQRSCGPLG